MANSSPSPTAVSGLASSPFTQMRHVGSTAANPGPYRSMAAANTSATVVPGSTSRPVPAACLADAKRRILGTSPTIPLPLMSRPSTRILVLRHGQSTWNAEGRWQGQADPPLTTLGEIQAGDAATPLGAFAPFAAVVASDLERAARTASIIATAIGHGPVVLDERLRERHAGAWQGLTRDDVEAGWPGYLDSHRRPDGFEGSTSAGRRAMAALVDIAARVGTDGDGAGDAALVISHGGILRAVRHLLGVADDLGFPNLSGQWFTVDRTGIEPGEMVSLLDLERPAVISPL